MLVPLASAPDVVALVPTLALSERLTRCVEAVVASATSLRVGVLVVVNAPVAELGRAVLPDGVEVVRTGLNLGWAGGLRFARALVDAPLLWLVQDDMVVSRDALTGLHGALAADPALGVVSPVVAESDGTLPAGSWGGVLSAEGELTWLPSEDVRRPLVADLPHLDYVPSRGMLVRTSVWDAVGGMDPRYYPVMWADVDFCFRVTEHGSRFSLVTEAEVSHAQHASTGRTWAEFLFERNRELFLSRWRPAVALDRERSPATSTRPVSPVALSGAVDPRVPPDLLTAVAQAAADTALHLGRFVGRLASDSADAVAALAAADVSLRQLRTELDETRRDHQSERLAWQARVEGLEAQRAAREAADERDRAAAQQRLASLQAELEEARAERDRRQERVAELLSSTSWRLTRPLRVLSDVLARRPSP